MIAGTRLGSERTPKRSFEEMAMRIRVLFELRLPYEDLYRLHCGAWLDHLRYAWIEKNRLEAQSMRGNFYPDLLDKRISLLRQKIREVLTICLHERYKSQICETISSRCLLDSGSDASTGPVTAPCTRKSDLSAVSTRTAPPGSSRRRWL
jgi:hypothetical protein